ncbi:transcription factor jumonji [Heterostelium album PN500]|uniref:Transcription factor jumonji n=1 Tax=Heterostelium pallidum (strain ATCC 26659 / Pp 5 / PN500) TaxID=670386 RepID=D3BV71_HETP5|nr:transcription factor jumonji [Heterostelium album PN500]EFA74628.1 transcription factor jumonji [Heterostelium album PN500]|eukprot:XP_020426762.1 transcription factor jumonji [Heterostelium album PN500]
MQIKDIYNQTVDLFNQKVDIDIIESSSLKCLIKSSFEKSNSYSPNTNNDDDDYNSLISIYNEVNSKTYQIINSVKSDWKQLDIIYRDIYSYSSILISYYSLAQQSSSSLSIEDYLLSLYTSNNNNSSNSNIIQSIISKLDYSLVFGGNLFYKLIIQFIDCLTVYVDQQLSFSSTNININYNNSNNNSNNNNDQFNLHLNINKSNEIERVELPSLQLFQSKYMNVGRPVIIKQSMQHWPAITTRPWRNLDYLKSVAGLRTVPIEIGSTYLDDKWTQQLMTINQFIDNHIINNSNNSSNSKREIGYLAQTRLFEQITKLRNDIVIPDYCFLSNSNSNNNQDQDQDSDPIINAWFGPSGTTTPLHFDRYNNLLCQVVGSKYIRLYSADQSHLLYPYENDILSNTSRINIESVDLNEFPKYKDTNYFECILNEGEALYIPPRKLI